MTNQEEKRDKDLAEADAAVIVNEQCRTVKLPRGGWVVLPPQDDGKPLAYGASEAEAKQRAIDALASGDVAY